MERDDGFGLIDEEPGIARELLAAIVRSADDAIYSKDTNGIVTSWNVAAERLYGYTPKEMIGRPISIIVPSDRAGEEFGILQKVLEGHDVDHYETERVTRDGRIIDVSITASPLHDTRGTIIGASVIARDITATKTTRGVVDRLAAIVQGSEDAIYSKDRRAIVDSWNPGAERLYGYTAAEAIGRHIRFLVPLKRKGEETEILNRILAGERIEHYETERLTKSGHIANVSISVSPVHDERGQVIGAAVIARDIEARARLAQLQRSLDRTELVARVVHDLRNPISALLATASLLADDAPLRDEQRSAARDAIARQGQRVTSLINDLLDLSYLESGRYQVDIRPVEASDVVKDVLDTAPPPDERRVMIDIADESLVMADPARLGQVLINLLTNAYKYGGDHIRIAVRADAERVSIEVSDNGSGVPDMVRDQVFEPFTRGHTHVPGTGLGLAITARLIEAQGGAIWLEEGHGGARFVIQLPRASAIEEPAS